METRAHHVLIGTFTLLVVTAGLLFVLWLGKSSVDHAYAYYDVVFNESVTGLSKGGMVQYNGIKVGQVANLRLDPRDPRKVIARIQVGSDTPVKLDTHARLGLLGLTGVAFIQLTGGSPGSPPLRASDDEHVPVIVADNSELSKLLNSGEDIATNTNEILQRIQSLLSASNVARVSATLKHLDESTAAVAAERAQMRQTLQQMALASTRLSDALGKLDHLAGTADTLVSTQGKATLESAQASLRAFQRMSAQLAALIAQNRGALAAGSQGAAELGPTLRQLQQTLRGLDALGAHLRHDPAAYLLGRDAAKEYHPQ